jgi:4-amino-4-deoxy-L-arabinose transferase-like glycosyltransferase
LARSHVSRLGAALILLYVVYFSHLSATGLLGPDEPRYASIGREMARSGDFITPRLWGEPWFEKPALLYWMTAVGFRAGLPPELAPRAPVAIASVAFLLLFAWRLRVEFDNRIALYSTAVLATSAGWIAYSQIAVTDVPLAATFSAAVLLLSGWVARGDRRLLPWAGAALGLAVLAKGLVPLVLLAPMAWFGRRRWRDVLSPAVWGAFAVVALPWYVLCYRANGWPFVQEFFVEHHFGRFATDALRHEQPFWFFLPVLFAGAVPWTPAALAVFRRDLYADVRLRIWAAIFVFGLVFFSASTNKLPGYVLPLLPAASILTGAALAKSTRRTGLLASCALLTSLFPLAADVLPVAVARGLSRAALPTFHWTWLLGVPIAATVALLERAGRRTAAVTAIAAGAAVGVMILKVVAYPALDARVSARSLWGIVQPCASEACVGDMHRARRYGLNYYSVTPLPDCAASGRPIRLEGNWDLESTSCTRSLTVLSPPL